MNVGADPMLRDGTTGVVSFSLLTRNLSLFESFVQVVDPSDQLRSLHTLDLEVEYQASLAAACQYALQLQIVARIDFLMRNVGGYVDEVAGRSLGFKFQTLAPAQSCDSVEYINHGLQVAVVMGARLRLGVNREGARPKLGRSRVFRRNGREAMQARRLDDIGIELTGMDNPYTIRSPPGLRAIHVRSVGRGAYAKPLGFRRRFCGNND